jgi:hypothetical protein
MAKYTNIRVVPGTPETLLSSDEAYVPTRYFGTDAKTGEEVELLSTSEYSVGQGPQNTAFIAKPLGEWYQGKKGVYNDSGIFKPFEAVDAEGNVIGTWNMAKNDLSDLQKYGGTAVKAVAMYLAGQALLPSITEAIGLEGFTTPETPAGDVPVGGASYAPGSFQEFLTQEGLKTAGATPVPGSFQSYLSSIGINPLIQGGVNAGISSTDIPFNLSETLKDVGRLAESFTPKTVQQQAGLVSEGGASQPRGVDYSSLLGLLQGKAGLLPTAEPYRRGLL